MECNDLLNNELEITPAARSYLLAAAKWGKFLSIVGFIFCGLVTIMAIFMGPLLATFTRLQPGNYRLINPVIITGLYIFLSIIFFFPCLYLFRFSGRMQEALESNNQENLDIAFFNLKAILKFYGVITLVILSLYLLVFIIGIFTATMR